MYHSIAGSHFMVTKPVDGSETGGGLTLMQASLNYVVSP